MVVWFRTDTAESAQDMPALLVRPCQRNWMTGVSLGVDKPAPTKTCAEGKMT